MVYSKMGARLDRAKENEIEPMPLDKKALKAKLLEQDQAHLNEMLDQLNPNAPYKRANDL